MFGAIRVPVKLRRPAPPKRTAAQEAAIKADNAARIWETARIAEKSDNYCIPTPEGFEVRYHGKTKRITGADAAGADMMAAKCGVDAADWILYLYVLEG